MLSGHRHHYPPPNPHHIITSIIFMGCTQIPISTLSHTWVFVRLFGIVFVIIVIIIIIIMIIKSEVSLTLYYDCMCSEMDFTPEKSNYKNSQLLLTAAAALS